MGMTPAAAYTFHELSLCSNDELLTEMGTLKLLANAQINPRKRQIYSLYDNWR